MLVQARSLTKTYPEAGADRHVLRGLDLDVREGEVLILLGRSGSGKSTLLNLIGGMDAPSGGTLLVAGQDIARLTETQRTLYRRRQVGYVFQFFNLVPTLTVRENVLLPLALNGIRDERRADELLHEVGLGDRGHTYPDRLSGGEQQRVAIARALVHDPPLVLADEPTGNLDETTATTVLQLLDKLVRQRGRTLIAVTHARELLSLADRALHLHEGRLEAETLMPAAK